MIFTVHSSLWVYRIQMSRAIALAQVAAPRLIDGMRALIVLGCAFALIMAERALPTF